MVGLNVEDELALGPFFSIGQWLRHFRRRDIKELAEDRIHGNERGGHASAGGQELAAADSESLGVAISELDQTMLDQLLVVRLRERVVFLVRNHLSRNRQIQPSVIVVITFTDPAAGSPAEALARS